jgi:ribosomal protein S18 acetylase RimI-like enzyme
MMSQCHQIDIVPFSEAYAPYFSLLNTQWLQQYFVVEPIDQQMLGSPEEFFINKGGKIYFALYNGKPAGTFALLKITDDVFELSKMAVDPEFQGKKIGNRMLEFCLLEAHLSGLKKLILYSNTRLEAAIHLYRKYGFVEVPVNTNIYKRSNIKMELAIA